MLKSECLAAIYSNPDHCLSAVPAKRGIRSTAGLPPKPPLLCWIQMNK